MEDALIATRHRLGFPVKVLGGGGLPSHDARRWQSGPHLRDSLRALHAVLEYLDEHDLRMYRVATALAPYASHPELPQFHHQVEECAEELAEIGAFARARDIRISSHPGQYTVLNSEREETVQAAVAELNVQAALFDAMGLGAESRVLIHVGGAAGGEEAAIDRFVAGFERLTAAAQARLAVENDDRTFGLTPALSVAKRTGIPVIWDVLHHHCHDPDRIPDAEALGLALDTWPPGVVPKIHYSSPRLDMELRPRKQGARTIQQPWLPPLLAHADLIDPLAFESFLTRDAAGRDFDVMLEAKAKDLAVLRLRDQLVGRGLGWQGGSVLVPRALESSS